jgi:hypothetical protein
VFRDKRSFLSHANKSGGFYITMDRGLETKDHFEPLYVCKDHTTKPNGLYMRMDRCLEDKESLQRSKNKTKWPLHDGI